MAPTIMLMDPDPLSRRDWEALLHEQGYAVVAVTSGEDVVLLCPFAQPDLILINVSSPDFCGPDICSRVKADPRNRLIFIMLIAGLTEASTSSPAPEFDPDETWRGTPSRWEVLNRLRTLFHMRGYIDEQAVSVITSLARSIEGRDPYTRGHSDRLLTMVQRFGRSLDMKTADLEALGIAALIHDVGKVIVPDSILLKPGPLTSEEDKIMKLHPIEGERICSPLRSLRDALPIIRHHHERMDGSGYPDGLRQNLIPYGARVLQVADIYDSLTTDRCYRKCLTRPMALQMLLAEVNRGWLDGEIVDRFASFVVARSTSNALARFDKRLNSRSA
jgi:putative two-component system response regulator